MLKIMPSDPNFNDVYIVATMLAVYKNTCMFYDLVDMPKAERDAEISFLETTMNELMEELGR